MSTPSSTALTSRISSAFRAGSSVRVRVARARDGRRLSIVRRADGSGGRGRGDGKAQDVDEREGVDWDGAWNTFCAALRVVLEKFEEHPLGETAMTVDAPVGSEIADFSQIGNSST